MLSSQLIRRPAVLIFVAIAGLLCLVKLSYSLGQRPWRSTTATTALQKEHNDSNRQAQQKQHQAEGLVKPTNVNITGMVFFGRRDRVESMNCYIEVGFLLLALRLWHTGECTWFPLPFLNKKGKQIINMADYSIRGI